MNIDETMKIDNSQAMIMFGWPIPKIVKGARANFAGYDVEISDIKDGNVHIRRVANDQSFHELDHWNDGEDRQREKCDGTTTIVGPAGQGTLAPGQAAPTGDVVVKVDVLGPEDMEDQEKKARPPGWWTNKPVPPDWNTRQEALMILQGLKAARRADGLDKPIMAQKE